MRVRVPPSASRFLVIAAALLASACDRAVMDPALDGRDPDALLSAAGITTPATRNTLPALLETAVREVQRAQGTTAARAWIQPLEQLREHGAELDLRREQLRLVLSVHGGVVAERVVHAEQASLTTALERLAVAGERGAGLEAWAEHARGELQRAQAALALGDSASGLDHATRAADAVARLRRGLSQLDYIQALPELLERARREHGESPELNSLQQQARESLRSRDRDRAYRALAELRREEVATVLRHYGDGAARSVVARVDVAAAELEPRVGANVRLHRMLRSARDLNVRAAAALEAGKPATALDLGSHAAGLINALRLALDSN